MKINLIWAMARNGVIGKNNTLPWHLPNDLKHFKQVTMGKPVIMGLRTYHSIGKPLPGRKNIVLSHEQVPIDSVFIASSIDEALEFCKDDEEVFVIGGATVYKQFLPLAHTLYITVIDEDVAGDVYFPVFKLDDWELTETMPGVCDEKNTLKHEFQVYRKKE